MDGMESGAAGSRVDRWHGLYAERAAGMVASEVRALFAVAGRPEVVSLAGGMPFVSALPMDQLGGLIAAEGRRVKLLYTVPTFQNPAGVTLSAARRAEVLELCRRFGVLVVEDNPYGLLTFDGDPGRAMRADASEDVVYLGTFSKTLAP